MDEDITGDKIEQIAKFIEELEPAIPNSFEEYKIDFKVRAICERYFEKIIEAVVDLAFIIIKEKKFNFPEDEESSFIILYNKNIISLELYKKLRAAKGMRNIIAHEYGKIDDEKVFHAVSEELIPDVNEFLRCIESVK